MKPKLALILIVALLPFLAITPTKFKISAQSSYLPYITQSFTIPGLKKNQLFLFQATPYEVRPGEQAVLLGSGFDNLENHISFGGKDTVMATSSNGTEMIITIPESLSNGTYILTVYNKLGTNDPNIPVSIKVTGNPENPPSITNIEENDGVIEISGNGFEPSNTVITPLGSVENVKSNHGDTIKFKVEDLSNYQLIKSYQNGKSATFPLPIYIQNEHGVSTTSASVNVTI